VEQDPTFAKKVGQIIILGGAFQVNGNVNPAAEANVNILSIGSTLDFLILTLFLCCGSKRSSVWGLIGRTNLDSY